MLPAAVPAVVHVIGKLTGVGSLTLLFLLWFVGVVKLGFVIILSRFRAMEEGET